MSIYITIQIGWSFDKEHVLDLGVMLGMDVSISDYKHQLITPCQSGPEAHGQANGVQNVTNSKGGAGIYRSIGSNYLIEWL